MKNLVKSVACFRRVCSVSVFSAVIFLAACASGPDPYEGYNRKMFAFNSVVDRALFKPVAKAYDTVTPGPVQKGVTNFFINLGQPIVIANDLLQLNMEWFFSDITRLVVNTTVGIGGLFDVASAAGIERHRQDFGLTLARWGMTESPYLLVPLLPPSTPRDLFGMGVDYYAGITTYFDFGWVTYAALGLSFINDRASVLSADKLIEESFDPYIFVRDAYLERRSSQIQRVLNPHGDMDSLSDENFVSDAATSDESSKAVSNETSQGPKTESAPGQVSPDVQLGAKKPSQGEPVVANKASENPKAEGVTNEASQDADVVAKKVSS